MTIKSIQADYYDVRLPHAMGDSTHGVMSSFTLVTARVTTDDGQEGIGYTYGPAQVAGRATASLIQDDLAPILVGQDPRRVESLWQRMWFHTHYAGRGGLMAFALSAVDMALWDLKARAANEPLWRLLGGHSNRVKAYGSGIDLNLPLDDLLTQVQGFLDRGLRAVKMKIGRDRLSEDLERIAAVRNLIGPETPLMVDANYRWTVEEAIRAARAMAEYNPYWLEEPTIPDDIDGHLRIAQEGGLPVATGENFRTVYEFQKAIVHGGIAFPEPDVTNIGGVTPFMKVAHFAEVSNLPVTTHGAQDVHVQLLAAIPNASYLEMHGFGMDDYVKYPLQIDEGDVIAPGRPGHGVEFNWDKLEEFRVAG